MAYDRRYRRAGHRFFRVRVAQRSRDLAHVVYAELVLEINITSMSLCDNPTRPIAARTALLMPP